MRTAYSLLRALAVLPLCALATGARAQDGAGAGAAPPTSPGASATGAASGARGLLIEKGEIRLDGRITAMTGAGGNGFDIKAFSFTTQAGKLIEFDEARDKGISGGAETKVYAGDDLQRSLGWGAVKLGMRVAVIGRDGGSGKNLQARAIVLSEFASKYVAGRSVKASGPVAALVAKGRAAFDGRDFQRAQKLFREAASTGAGSSDASSTSLALSWEANAFREMGQNEKAVQALREALTIREGLDEPGAANSILSSLASLYIQMGQAAQAVPLLERANQNTEGDSEALIALYKSNLGRAYMANKQWASAAEVFRALAARFKVSGETEREVAAMLSAATALSQLGKADEAAALLKGAKSRAEGIADAAKKAEALASLGSYLASTGDKEGARTTLNQALDLYNGQGDSRAAAEVRLELTKLDAPDAAPAPAAPAAPAPATPEG